MRVLKFGGTSVVEPERIRTVVDLVPRRRHESLVIVLSAAAGVTERGAAGGTLLLAEAVTALDR